jgi:hypothetical protein
MARDLAARWDRVREVLDGLGVPCPDRAGKDQDEQPASRSGGEGHDQVAAYARGTAEGWVLMARSNVHDLFDEQYSATQVLRPLVKR